MRIEKWKDGELLEIVDLPNENPVEAAKAIRAVKVSSIVVSTQAGNTFDGNEEAQNRMARALAGMDDADVVPWVLADNSIVSVGKAELREALRLSGQAQTELWVKPYTNT